MEKAKQTGRRVPAARDPERVLGEYYGQLKKWASILTRGDLGMAEEIVHDLCLHFTLVKPDLSQVANLDGYLYTCLRHLYLSALARSSREAVQTVSIADFDSIRFALGACSSDSLLERQNELRRICSYMVWRKDSSKSASCFILHFFHDYARREVAKIACLPIAAIYNKLKSARSDLKFHLESSGKLTIAIREAPPEPRLAVGTVSSAELLNDLKHSILGAKRSECPSEEALLVQYRATVPRPIPCGLLSHIVSCERCLTLLDRYIDRHDGEPPTTSAWSSKNDDGTGSDARDDRDYLETMSEVKWQKKRVYEHRPRTLSIAVNGRIAALHDVQGERSTLASRIEHPESVQFVEVFTDQQIRLALLLVDELPPDGLHVHTQKVALSDGRWLELKLSFDGLGLHSEVTYLDPALAAGILQDDADEELAMEDIPLQPVMLPVAASGERSYSLIPRFARSIFGMRPRYAPVWAMSLAILIGSSSYLAYRKTHELPSASVMLDESVRLETAELKGETEHRILQLDAIGAGGDTVWHGTVDVWQEPESGRSIRRLYDAQHRLVAAEWRGKNDQRGSYSTPSKEDLPLADREVGASPLWEQGVSARAFQALDARQMQISAAGDNYELTGIGIGNGPPHVVSATLILDHGLHFAGETLRVTGGFGITEVRFVQAGEERKPSGSVPDSIFDASDLDTRLHGNPEPPSVPDRVGADLASADERLVQTLVAVLYRLSELGADVAEPIQITRTHGGRIRISGTVENESREKQIVSALESLPDHQLLELQLSSQSDLRFHIPLKRATTSGSVADFYDVAQTGVPVDALLRRYFAAKGLSGERLDSAVAQYSRNALDHAQRALQNAYALDRLSKSFTGDELQTMGPVSQQQWAAMVKDHATSLQSGLRQLHDQLAPLIPTNSEAPGGAVTDPIGTPANFKNQTQELLHRTQDMNRAVGSAFSSGPADRGTQSPGSLISAAMDTIPLQRTEQIAEFASRLAAPENLTNRNARRDPRQSR